MIMQIKYIVVYRYLKEKKIKSFKKFVIISGGCKNILQIVNKNIYVIFSGFMWIVIKDIENKDKISIFFIELKFRYLYVQQLFCIYISI